MSHEHVESVQPPDLEIGATEAVQRHMARHVVARKPVSQLKLDFEHRRPRWLREVMAEAVGVFFYVFPGIAATAIFTVEADHSPLGVTASGSLFQIGWAYAMGIAFAIITCAPVSGGHFNPAITLALAFWQGFPWRKVPLYILGQIFGAFVAGLLMMGMYWPEMSAMNARFLAAGPPLVANGAPASALCSFPNNINNPAGRETNLGYVVLTEFFVDSFIGLVIWAVLDPANPFVTPASAPFTIGLAYGTMVWAFAGLTISTNLARDLGTRLVAALFYGPEVFTYMNYSPVGILVNVPATLFATAFYELLMRDSLAIIGRGRARHEDGEEGLRRHISRPGVLKKGVIQVASSPRDRDGVKLTDGV
ncbi:aquaporin-like protein [Xylariomycetidae sp. FL2044]|nr:aquaporin-like protein [Xylariomycetidae sp. FL2044]